MAGSSWPGAAGGTRPTGTMHRRVGSYHVGPERERLARATRPGGATSSVGRMADSRDLALDAVTAFDRPTGRAKQEVDAVRDRLADGRDRALLTEIVYGV